MFDAFLPFRVMLAHVNFQAKGVPADKTNLAISIA